MEKAVDNPRNTWPTLFDSGWMEKFFHAPLDEFFNVGKTMNVPAVNISETDTEFKLTIGAPGLEKSDFRIEYFDNMLSIGAEKEKEEKEEKIGRFNRREYNYSSWSRSFMLPENADVGHIEARYENGELKLAIPKTGVTELTTVKTINVS